MSTTEQGVRRAEGYLYSSLHQGFPILPALVLLVGLDGISRPISWLIGWGVLVAASGWTALTVLHTRLRDLALLPPSGWDRWFRSEHKTAFLVAWIVLSLAATGTAALFAPSSPLLLGAVDGTLGGILATPALVVRVAGVDSFPARKLRTGIAIAFGIALSLIAVWTIPPADIETLQIRFGTTFWSSLMSVFIVGFASMFINVIATTRALEQARVDEARLAVAEERVRFARDLHDVFGRTLSAVALKSELAAALAERGRPEAATTMREVQAIATDALTEVREVVRGYREADLATEISGAKALLEAAGIQVSTIHEGSAALPAPVARAFAWTVREAATNVLRHADASIVRVFVRADEQLAQLTIINDHPHPAGNAAGSGLSGLSERLAEVGGTLAWDQQADAFTLTATVEGAALRSLRQALDEESA
ncbi:histidine kinase [Propionimicrobium sp. PCR01-08-3]|uniref:sensor histidine kinase n=1 Tax=Propionimicrobium sp. PCR01-08-3 TaxID=3052086 RepID=UPI00255C7E25|nr:histidine kinase [Propionimicrobium sp. PCR01-08-3]WIY82938.1 histidine kinase [Propionimicrobium sp. PCR01-08-3]